MTDDYETDAPDTTNDTTDEPLPVGDTDVFADRDDDTEQEAGDADVTGVDQVWPTPTTEEPDPAEVLPLGEHDVTEAAEAAAAVEAVEDLGGAEGEAGDETAAEADEAEPEEAEVEEIEEDDPWTRPGDWYVVHTQSGYEKKVTANLHARISSMNMEDKIYEVVIPMEEVDEFRNGRKQTVQRKVFPGYLLVRCRMDDESWYCIRNTPGVTGFVGQAQHGRKPTPLSRREVRNFLSTQGVAAEQQARRKPKLDFEIGESVRVKEGPFADFSGEIAEINADHLKMKVLVNIFGRETLVEMDFSQVAKL